MQALLSRNIKYISVLALCFGIGLFSLACGPEKPPPPVDYGHSAVDGG